MRWIPIAGDRVQLCIKGRIDEKFDSPFKLIDGISLLMPFFCFRTAFFTWYLFLTRQGALAFSGKLFRVLSIVHRMG